jgi:acetyl-CoA carboxylase carboxyltransferase component
MTKSLPEMVRTLLSYLPQNNLEDPPAVTPKDNPARAEARSTPSCPTSPNDPYDIKQVITKVVDMGSFFEVQSTLPRIS